MADLHTRHLNIRSDFTPMQPQDDDLEGRSARTSLAADTSGRGHGVFDVPFLGILNETLQSPILSRKCIILAFVCDVCRQGAAQYRRLAK